MITAHAKIVLRLPGEWDAETLKHAISEELRMALSHYCAGLRIEAPAVTIEHMSAIAS